MARVHELAHRWPVRSAHAFSGVQRALNFTYDMAGATEDDVVHFVASVFELASSGIPKRSDAQSFCRLLALSTTLGVFAAGERVFHIGVGNEQGDGRVGHRDQLRLTR